MQIIPAIDLIEGKCVRLTEGDYAQKKIYNEDPLEVAKAFEGIGLMRLHLVDLDGAKAGEVVNWKVLEKIANQTKLKIDYARFWFLDKLFNLEYDLAFIDFGTNAFEFDVYFESRKKKMIVHFHGYDISKSLKSKKYLDWIVEFTKFNKIIVPSNYNASRLEVLGCYKDNIFVIPYAFYSDLSILNKN